MTLKSPRCSTGRSPHSLALIGAPPQRGRTAEAQPTRSARLLASNESQGRDPKARLRFPRSAFGRGDIQPPPPFGCATRLRAWGCPKPSRAAPAPPQDGRELLVLPLPPTSWLEHTKRTAHARNDGRCKSGRVLVKHAAACSPEEKRKSADAERQPAAQRRPVPK